jgi:hypothetical protein
MILDPLVNAAGGMDGGRSRDESALGLEVPTSGTFAILSAVDDRALGKSEVVLKPT